MRWPAIVVTASVLGLSGCGGGDAGGAARTAARQGAVTTSTGAVAGPSTVAAPPTTAAAVARPGGTTSVAPGGAGAPAQTAAAPRRANPVAPGRYAYATDGTAQISGGPPRRLPVVTTLVVDRPEGRRQRSVRDLRDRDGVGSVTETTLEYADDGVRILALRLQTNFAGIASTYNLTAPDRPVVVRTGALPGETGTFTLQGDGLTIVTNVKVERVEGDALVVILDSTLSGQVQGTQRAVNWISTTKSLTTKEEVTADATSRGVRLQTYYTAVAKGTDPP